MRRAQTLTDHSFALVDQVLLEMVPPVSVGSTLSRNIFLFIAV